MTRLGAQWTMGMIMVAAILGAGVHKGLLNRPAWPRTTASGDHRKVEPIANQDPAQGQVEDAADQPDMAQALDSAVDRGTDPNAIDLPSANGTGEEDSATTNDGAAQTPTPERQVAAVPPTAALAAEPTTEASPETVPVEAQVEASQPSRSEYVSAPAREPTRVEFVGSIRIPARLANQTYEDQVTAMRAAADLTPEQAGAEALRHLPSAVVTTTTIGNENGYLVYRVQLAGQDGRVHEVIVDAGTGRALIRSSSRSLAMARPRVQRVRSYVGNDDESGRPQ